MKKILVAMCLSALFLEISGLVYFSSTDGPNTAQRSLLESPEWKLTDPRQNGYFFLLGFSAAPTSDPISIGYKIWTETSSHPQRRLFQWDDPRRSELFLSPNAVDTLTPLIGTNPIHQLQAENATLRNMISRHRLMVSRYRTWLALPFEDRGFERAGSPRFPEIFAAHRLYVGEGFLLSETNGLKQLERDLRHWRTILREARTLPVKVMAGVIVCEDAKILSDLLSQPTISSNSLANLTELLTPLDKEERSLLWPIRHEFQISLSRPTMAFTPYSASKNSSSPQKAWLASMADLHPDAFATVEQSLSSSVFGITLGSQRTQNMYALYYQAIIKASESGPTSLPKLHTVEHRVSRTLLDTLLYPVHVEPRWDQFTNQLGEINARIRLAGVQALLRRPPSNYPVPARIAEAGSQFYDPFTEMPLLWNKNQKRLYSVGKDLLDDGGDPTFDIVVPVVTHQPETRTTRVPKKAGTNVLRKTSRRV